MTKRFRADTLILVKILKDIRFLSVIAFLAVIGIVVGVMNYFPKSNISPAPETNNLDPIPTELPQNEIRVTKDGFEPGHIEIKRDTVIVWYNESGDMISINSDQHPDHTLYPELNLGNLESGQNAQAFFTEPGTYTYHNDLKPEQRGTIIVQ